MPYVDPGSLARRIVVNVRAEMDSMQIYLHPMPKVRAGERNAMRGQFGRLLEGYLGLQMTPSTIEAVKGAIRNQLMRWAGARMIFDPEDSSTDLNPDLVPLIEYTTPTAGRIDVVPQPANPSVPTSRGRERVTSPPSREEEQLISNLMGQFLSNTTLREMAGLDQPGMEMSEAESRELATTVVREFSDQEIQTLRDAATFELADGPGQDPDILSLGAAVIPQMAPPPPLEPRTTDERRLVNMVRDAVTGTSSMTLDEVEASILACVTGHNCSQDLADRLIARLDYARRARSSQARTAIPLRDRSSGVPNPPPWVDTSRIAHSRRQWGQQGPVPQTSPRPPSDALRRLIEDAARDERRREERRQEEIRRRRAEPARTAPPQRREEPPPPAEDRRPTTEFRRVIDLDE